MEQKEVMSNERFVKIVIDGIKADDHPTYYEDLASRASIFAEVIGFLGNVDTAIEIIASKLNLQTKPIEVKDELTDERFMDMMIDGIAADVFPTFYEDLISITPRFAEAVGFTGDINKAIEIVADKLKIVPMPEEFRQAKFESQIIKALMFTGTMLSKEVLFDYISMCSEVIPYEVDIEKATDKVFSKLFLNSLN